MAAGTRAARSSRWTKTAWYSGKAPPIVLEQDEPALLNLGIGRVDVGHVNLAARERPVSDVVVEPADLGGLEPVARAHRRPPVGPVHELVREAEAQLGVTGQVGHGTQAEARGVLLPHAEAVAVVEAERARQADALPREQVRQLRGRGLAIEAEDLAHEGARVLGVEVEVPAQERRPEDARAAEGAAVLGAHATLGRRPLARSPSSTDSVNVFEPTRTGGGAAISASASKAALTGAPAARGCGARAGTASRRAPPARAGAPPASRPAPRGRRAGGGAGPRRRPPRRGHG